VVQRGTIWELFSRDVLRGGLGGQNTVWSRDDGTPFPNLNTEPDLDDLTPEESVTKQLWLNLYEGIERWRKESSS
jgi:hypothetical protein